MSNLPSYKTPPLEEVSIGCQFKSLSNWCIPHTGKFWLEFEKEFPNLQHAQPITGKDGFPPVDVVTGFPISRVWFINEDESRLIQFQPDRLNFNWRKRDKTPEYPHYTEIAKNFFQFFNLLKKFVSSNQLGLVQPEMYDLTYTNFIYPEPEKSISETINSVFEGMNLIYKSDFLPESKNISWSSSINVESLNANFTIKLVQAKKVNENDEFIRLDINVKSIELGHFENDPESWFNQAHEDIVNCFAEITSNEWQSGKWGKE